MELCAFFNVPHYGPLQYDDSHREEIIAFFRQQFKTKSLDEWEALLADVEACWAPVKRLDEVLAEPLFKQREMITQAEDKSVHGTHLIGSPIKLSRTPAQYARPAVRFGQDTQKILIEMGYSDDAIEEFKLKQAI